MLDPLRYKGAPDARAAPWALSRLSAFFVPGWFPFISFASHCSPPFYLFPLAETAPIPRSGRSGGASALVNVLPGSTPPRSLLCLPECCQSMLNFRFQCLSKLPHNPKLYATLNTSVSLIPPIATNDSYYDGMAFLTWATLVLTRTE